MDSKRRVQPKDGEYLELLKDKLELCPKVVVEDPV